jgi:hypothetical protein
MGLRNHYTADMDTTLRDVPAPGWLYQAGAKIQSIIGYPGFTRECLRRQAPGRIEAAAAQVEADLGKRMREYPHNHYYRILQGRLVPGFQLYERLRLVARTYPQPLDSFLDIGCCRGFYVLDAAGRLGCPRAVGTDVHEPFVATAQEVARHLRLQEAAFHYASLGQVSDDPQKFGGPFQTVLLIGTYHYLFWGSNRCPIAYYDHDEIFRRLASICTDRLILSGRITVRRLHGVVEDQLEAHRDDVPRYTAQAFLRSAGKFFEVRHVGYLGADPLFVMTKRFTSGSPS